jgi:hypothetical protein
MSAVAIIVATLTGVVIAATRPVWITDPLQAVVASAGPAGPAVFLVLSAAAAPFHLSGVLVVLSPLFWPTPIAAVLSFAGSLTGCVLTASLLRRAGVVPLDSNRLPPWLARRSSGVAERPLAIGLAARLVLHTGIALEAFYVLTGYSWRQYLLVTTLGIGAWVAQALLGIQVLAVLVEVSPWLGFALVFAPIALLVAVAAPRRRQKSTGEGAVNPGSRAAIDEEKR